MAGTAATKTGFPGIEIHGRSIRVAFMHKGVRHRPTLGRNRFIDILLPEDIQQLRADLIATKAVSTVNHYLAAFSGFLYWYRVPQRAGSYLGAHAKYAPNLLQRVAV
ncbi:MAG: hypothetical protein ACK5HY_05320 [Parahaliea sp.]